jgi:thymidylate kinase
VSTAIANPAPAPGVAGPAPALTPIPLVAALLTRLEDEHVRYCHWKSTTGIARALEGRTDLDLLVDREDAARFAEVTASLGFKPFISHVSRRFPGVADLLGHDEATGRIVHLHVYHQLVLGEHHVKNHRLPIESVVLDSATLRDGIRVPSPEIEVAILAMRTLLKYRDVDMVKDRLRLGRRGGIPADTLTELRDLGRRTTAEGVRVVIEHDLPMIPADVVLELLDLAAGEPRDAATLRRLRSRARAALARYERLPRGEARLRYLQARTAKQWPIRSLVGALPRSQAKRKSPASGGVTVAIVGPDGAGKTTIIDSLNDWLAWRVNVTTLYLGSARPSPGAAVARALVHAGRRGDHGVRRLVGGDHRAARVSAGASGVLDAVRAVLEARDRERRAKRGWRLAAQGWLVIFDRYPLPGIRVGERVMDGPRIASSGTGLLGGLIGRLAAAERQAYDRIPPPDHLVVLQVRPEVATGRKRPRDPATLAKKASALLALDGATLPGSAVHLVDAERPLDAVVAEVRDIVWREL